MRIRSLCLAGLGILALPTFLPAQSSFEGVVTYRVTAEGTTGELRFSVKGNKARMDVQVPDMPGEMYVLMDMERELVQSVIPMMGMYMEMDLKQAAGAAGTPADSVPPFRKLGTSDEIAGIRCENYRFGPVGNEETEMCIATGMGWFMGGWPMGGLRRGARSEGPNFAAYRDAFKDGMLPLRVSLLNNGRWVGMMEVTRVERTSLDDKLFVLPSGLQKMNIPGGPGGVPPA
jgi:hypothetical protein